MGPTLEVSTYPDRSGYGRVARAALGVALGTTSTGFGQQADAQQVDTQLAPVSVEGAAASAPSGYQAKQPSLDKLTQPLLDTPQSISVLPKALLDDKGITTLRDALRDVPGVSLAAGEGGQQGDNLSIRGFNAQLRGSNLDGTAYRQARAGSPCYEEGRPSRAGIVAAARRHRSIGRSTHSVDR